MRIWITVSLQPSQIKAHVGNAGQRNPLRLMRVQPLLSPCRPRQLHSLSCCCLHSTLPPEPAALQSWTDTPHTPRAELLFLSRLWTRDTLRKNPMCHSGGSAGSRDQIQTRQATGTNLPTSIYLCNPERRNYADWRKRISKHVAKGLNTIKKSVATRGL